MNTSYKEKIMTKKKYFGKPEEDAIRKLSIGELNHIEKEKIYNNIIHPAFQKLSENILNTYGLKHGFFKIGIDSNDLIKMGISHMYSCLDRFDPDYATKSGQPVKAFSFFGTVVKRYFILLSMKSQKSLERNVDIDDDEKFLKTSDALTLARYDSNTVSDERIFFDKVIEWFEKHKDTLIVTEIDRIVLNAIIDICNRVEVLENYNKKTIYFFLRELTNLEARQITPVIKKMKIKYKILRENYMKEGRIYSGSLTL